MTGITLVPAYRDHRIVLRFSWSFRAVFAVLAAVLLGAMLAVGAASGVALGLLALVTTVGLYDERWEFADREPRVVRRVGLVFWSRTRHIETAAVDSLQVTRFIKGSPSHFPRAKIDDYKRHQVGLYVHLTDGTRLTVETRPSDHPMDLVPLAREIARMTKIPLHET